MANNSFSQLLEEKIKSIREVISYPINWVLYVLFFLFLNFFFFFFLFGSLKLYIRYQGFGCTGLWFMGVAFSLIWTNLLMVTGMKSYVEWFLKLRMLILFLQGFVTALFAHIHSMKGVSVNFSSRTWCRCSTRKLKNS